MMKQMRENTKVILWVVVVAFVITIFAVWGLDLQTGGGKGPQSNNLGEVNGTPITRTEYQAVYERVASQYRASNESGSLTYMQQEMAREQAWKSIVDAILTEQQIKDLGIQVDDREILDFLRTSPPPEIQQYFVDEKGNFDYAKYQSALNNPEADWTGVEALARQRIPLYKLNQYLAAMVHVGVSEVKQAFEQQNTKLTVEYVSFPIRAESTGDYKPSDEEIQAYYQDHQADFEIGERAVLAYIRVPIEPTPFDHGELRRTMTFIKKELARGEDFGELAEIYSQAPTARDGGETGFISAAQGDSVVIDAASRLKPGEVSDPIETDDGAYLVELIEKRAVNGSPEYNLREIFVKLAAGPNTTDSLSAFAQRIQEKAAQDGMEVAAKDSGLPLQTTEPFEKEQPIPGLGYVPTLNRFALNNDVGTVSNVLNDENAYYVCRVARRLPVGHEPLDTVKPQIESALLFEKQKQVALRKAEAFRRKMTSGRSSMAEAAETYGYTVQRADTFTVGKAVAGMPPYTPFAYASFGAVEGTVTPPVESRGSYYVIQVIKRSEFDPESFQAQAEGLRQQLQQEKVQEFLAYWYEKTRKESDIEDYRGAF